MRLAIALALSLLLVFGSGIAEAKSLPVGGLTATRIAAGLQGAGGSTIGPDGALYVAEGKVGRISRVDLTTGKVTTFAYGLPHWIIDFPWGGPVDIAFIGHTAYVLVTLVGSDWGGHDVVGIYRIDGPSKFTVIADIGDWAIANPPPPIFPIDTPTGVQYSMQPYRDGFLVTDGHHNRVLRVTLDGKITQLIQFGDVVPTGLALRGDRIYLTQAGPIPHLPQNGKVLTLDPRTGTARTIASGAPLLVDVELGRGNQLYALSQGKGSGGPEGSPALPNTGSLLRVNGDGTLTVVKGGLDRPTSLELVGTTAYVVTLTGEVWRIDGISGPPYGTSR